MSSLAAPRHGRRVLVTRAEEDGREWASRLRQLGFEAALLPCIVCPVVDAPDLADRLAAALARADWLALTSRRGVESVGRLLGERADQLLAGTKLAVVGPATARAAGERWRAPDLVAPDGTAASLAEALIAALPSNGGPRAPEVVLALADRAGRALEEPLERRGVAVTRLAVYRTRPAPAEDPPVDLATWDLDAIFVASPSAVEGLTRRACIPPEVPIVSIGPTTTDAARRAGLAVAAEARERGLEGLVEALRESWADGRETRV